MPLIDIQVMTGLFDDEQKSRMAAGMADLMKEITGVDQSGWVRIQEIDRGDWAAGAGYMVDAPMQSLLSPYHVLMNGTSGGD